MKLARSILALAPTAFFGCSLLVDTSDFSGGTPPPSEGGAEDAPEAAPFRPETEAPVQDAGLDRADAPSTCNPAISLLDGRWTFRSDATRDGNAFVLAPAAQYKAGAAWWSEPALFDRFEARVTFRITGAPPTSDGIAFSWLRGEAVPGVGPTGGALAVSGLAGYGVIVDTFGPLTDASSPYVAVVDTSKDDDAALWVLAASAIGRAVADGVDHVLAVSLAEGTVSVRLDDALLIDRFALPGYVPYRGYWGVSSGTGQYFSDHRVTALELRSAATGCP